jgi:LysR family transcriptional regulator, glycine cleavage system transcriptional activator
MRISGMVGLAPAARDRRRDRRAGVAICSDVVVNNELSRGLLAKAHPLSLQGYGFYLVSMAHSPQAPVIEAFSRWMRAIG